MGDVDGIQTVARLGPGSVDLAWFGLVWKGLDRIGLSSSSRLSFAGLGWMQLDRIRLET